MQEVGEFKGLFIQWCGQPQASRGEGSLGGHRASKRLAADRASERDLAQCFHSDLSPRELEPQ